MPKTRNKKPKRIKRKQQNKLSVVFIIAGIICTALLWYLTKDPLWDTGNKVNESTSELNGEKQEKTETAKEKKKKYKSAKKTKKQIAKVEKTKAATTPQKSIQAIPQDMDTTIAKTLEKLGIPKSYYKRRKTTDLITYSVPINKATMDLLYANMILKGDLERQGATFVSGKDSSGKQSLIFQSNSDRRKYQINLFYDAKLYETTKKPMTIAIVVDDFGAIGGDLLDGFLSLDKEVCFAIFPDEPNSIVTMQKAKAQGRKTIIHVPMEPIGYPNVNPGKNAIFVQYTASQIERLLSKFINQLPDCEGINNHMGSLATTDEDVMRAVMTTLKKHNKFFLDSRTSNVSVGYSIAQKAHIRSYRNDLFLDSPNVSQSTMDAKLNQIIALSNTQSSIIAITHCHSQEKLTYLRRFIAKLKAAGFTLVPITEVGQYKVPELL